MTAGAALRGPSRSEAASAPPAASAARRTSPKVSPRTDGEQDTGHPSVRGGRSASVRGESFGMVLLEAMAAGCALVASDLDGHRNVATDGVDALLTPVGDPHALAKALTRVLDDDALRAELVAGGRRRADELSMTRLAERYVEIYSSVASAR